MSDYLLPSGDPIGLGSRVRISGYLARHADYSVASDTRRGTWRKVWKRLPMGSTSNEGVVVGVRTLSNGENRTYGYEEPIEYVATERFRAVLVSTGLHSRPLFALFEDVEVLP